jgi:hypothetical protein
MAGLAHDRRFACAVAAGGGRVAGAQRVAGEIGGLEADTSRRTATLGFDPVSKTFLTDGGFRAANKVLPVYHISVPKSALFETNGDILKV